MEHISNWLSNFWQQSIPLGSAECRLRAVTTQKVVTTNESFLKIKSESGYFLATLKKWWQKMAKFSHKEEVKVVYWRIQEVVSKKVKVSYLYRHNKVWGN